MSFSPEEIANRVFTPSAEGYHQGEVRDFLQRVAREVRSLQAAYAAQSGDPDPLAPLPGTVGIAPPAGDPARLVAVSDRIEALVAQLESAVAQTAAGTPPPASTPAAGASASVAASSVSPPPSPAAVPAAPVVPSVADTATATSPAVERDSRDSPTFIERVPVVVENAPAQPSPAAHVETAPLPRVPTDKLTPSVGSISATDPMFSDSANDLLDGVLDDVMDSLE